MARDSGFEIKEAVRARYSEVAEGVVACCESGCCAQWSPLYTIEEIGGLPAEAVSASAGCGNPTVLASIRPGETVVDFGSGGGIDCFLAARAVGPEGKVIGVDMTPEMVALARNNARKLGLTNVEFHVAEIEHTPVADVSVDAIISNCVICLAPDKDAVFREAFRILRPGGQLFVSDMVLSEELPEPTANDLSNWVSCVSGAELKKTYMDRLHRAGFLDLEITSDIPFGGDIQMPDGSEGLIDEWRSVVRSMNIKAAKPR